jgi:ribosomal protein L31E
MAEVLLTINMRKFLLKQKKSMRSRRAAGYVRDRVAHYLKLAPENVRLSGELNNMIIKYYSKSMHKLKLSVNVDKGIATAKPFEHAILTKKSAGKARTFQKMSHRLFPPSKAQAQGSAQAKPEVLKPGASPAKPAMAKESK